MNASVLKTKNNNLSDLQLKTFEKFRRKVKKNAPDFQITWVLPYSKSIIEIGLEFPQKMSYRKGLNVSKLATEVEDETGVTIVLR